MKKKNPYQSGANWLGKLAVYAIAMYNWLKDLAVKKRQTMEPACLFTAVL
jgi:hypothetical protein